MSHTMRLGISSTLLVGAFLFVNVYSHGEAVPIRRPLDSFPAELGSWRGQESTLLSEEVLDILVPTDYLLRRYEDGARRSVWLYIGYWETQRKGAQIHSPKNCLPGGGWEPLEGSVVPVEIGPGKTIEVNRYLLEKGTDQMLVLYWFQSQGEAIAGEIDAKIAMVKSSIFRHRSDGALVRVSSAARGDPAVRLEDFVRVMYPSLREFLPE
jgi:EpsI family protein